MKKSESRQDDLGRTCGCKITIMSTERNVSGLCRGEGSKWVLFIPFLFLYRLMMTITRKITLSARIMDAEIQIQRHTKEKFTQNDIYIYNIKELVNAYLFCLWVCIRVSSCSVVLCTFNERVCACVCVCDWPVQRKNWYCLL